MKRGRITGLGLVLAIGTAVYTDHPGYRCEPCPVVVLDAGIDTRVRISECAVLDGRGSELGPLSFWLADGDGPFEDQLMHYDSRFGVRPQSLRDPLNKPLGWPGDMVEAGGEVFGVDTSKSKIVVVQPATATFFALTEPISPKGRIHAMAYDTDRRELLVADSITQELFGVSPKTGAVRRVCGIEGLRNVAGLAWSRATGLLLLDTPTHSVYTIDQASGSVTRVCTMPMRLPGELDEIAFFRGDLYVTGVHGLGDSGFVQLYRVDLSTGELTKIGPRIHQCMGHSLVIQNIPCRTRWHQVDGPGEASIAAPDALVTDVRFPEPGTYEFELRPVGAGVPADRVSIEVRR